MNPDMPTSLDVWAAEASTLSWNPGVLIDGRLVPSQSSQTFDLVSPRDGAVLSAVSAGSSADVDAAVTSARAAFEDGRWAGVAPIERGAVLIRFADVVASRARELALRISLEMGKPAHDALAVELRAIVQCLRWYGQLADKLGDEAPVSSPSSLGLVTREPAGVVGAVVPWNFPLTMTGWKIGPALMAGNSVILKPAEQTSISALLLGELALEAGLPDGVLNVVPGLGSVVGEALGRHPDVDVISFTGSVGVGRRFLGYSAESNGKRVWPELGGKSASVVLADADAGAAGRTTAWGSFYNQGEMCSASSRMVVMRDVLDEAVDAALEQSRTMQPGDPLDDASQMGAIVSEVQLARMQGMVERALKDGATLAAGSIERFDIGSGRGSYLAPIVLTDVRPDMEIAQVEVFGPVLSVIAVASESEAIEVANGTPFGLAAGLWTKDLSAAHRVSRRLRAGTVWVNCYEEGNMSMPFGGSGASGFGRDKSAHAVDKYTDLKSTWIEL
ncbi:aldehyde dehydrogenase family protein [Subtercola endophyticus]|uniref:aldehyde dehydrogenase family protein n=1 Tax=Subtercola endophyticus TaxID=2895559 RepID=UPI001E5BD927|nr:aldehyde dehydrogenase family protein [Subtercola endophyticus]UFS57627.1 aldehyde dehydrogenase family protein [Subtercola endophyticus]